MNFLLQWAARIDRLNNAVGRALGWTVLLLVLIQFALILSVNVFRIGSIAMQESILYLNSLMFLAGAGYALSHDEHVRVDVFYRGASEQFKARVNLYGTLFFLFPTMGFLTWMAYPYVAQSVSILESSTETSGLPLIFLLKSFILVFAGLLLLQGASLAIKSYDILRGRN